MTGHYSNHLYTNKKSLLGYRISLRLICVGGGGIFLYEDSIPIGFSDALRFQKKLNRASIPTRPNTHWDSPTQKRNRRKAIYMCRGWGSNPRPQAYESCALPTELPRHRETWLNILWFGEKDKLRKGGGWNFTARLRGLACALETSSTDALLRGFGFLGNPRFSPFLQKRYTFRFLSTKCSRSCEIKT